MASPNPSPGFAVPTGVQVSPAGAQGSPGALPAISTDAGNIATLGSDSKILVPQSAIWSQRLRSYNALAYANCNFEIDQRLCGTAATFPANTDTWIMIDRCGFENKNASTGAYTRQQISANVAVPGTSYLITRKILRVTLTAAQASLAATDDAEFGVGIEGPFLRELVNDVHSMSILCRSSVANLKFGWAISAMPGTAVNRYILSKLCTLGAANTWTLITLPNLPVFPTTGFGLDPGFQANTGYYLGIQLAEGASRITSANDVWVSGAAGTWGAIGMSNFSASPVGSTFDLAFLQHEPGPVCSTLIDLDFQTNLSRCQRYFSASYDYGANPGTISGNGGPQAWIPANSAPFIAVTFPSKMATVPTLTGYSPATGAINNIRDWTSNTDRSISSAVAVGMSGFSGFNLTTPNTVIANQQYHYTADTGW
jgi:hypothetical protein